MEHIKARFESLFSSDPLMVRAPGRVNLIGEHTDYNNGFVLPAAIDKGITFAFATSGSSKCRLVADDLGEEYEFDINHVKPASVSWANYLLGVVAQIQERHHTLNGFNCVFGGNIPVGAGLSSSAALESGTALGLSQLFGLDIPAIERVHIAQKAEHTYAGVQCGIMDMFASTLGKEGHVIQLDCRSIQHTYFPFNMDAYELLLCNTLVSHSLAETEYNTRRQECEQGVQILQSVQSEISIQSLRDASPQLIEKHKDAFTDVIYRRCSFITRENERVLTACEALHKGQMEEFGKLMYQSHNGLQHAYEVSCKELDFLVDQTRSDNRVLGSRMMGGGFGGCTINLVKKEAIPEISAQLTKAYEDQFGRKPEIYRAVITRGTHVLV